MIVDLDSKDRQILKALMEDGRLSNQDLADRVNLSPSPCLRRVRLLEERGIITGYGAIVDQRAVGLPVTAFVGIKLLRHDHGAVAAFEAMVLAREEIVDCHMMAGEVDYLLRVVAADLADYERFVREVLHNTPGVGSIETAFAYGRIKQGRGLPIPGPDRLDRADPAQAV